MINPTDIGQISNTMHKLTYYNKLSHPDKLHNYETLPPTRAYRMYIRTKLGSI